MSQVFPSQRILPPKYQLEGRAPDRHKDQKQKSYLFDAAGFLRVTLCECPNLMTKLFHTFTSNY
eukprot:m.87397 g.87397  ORF g.87397 m.87397 type:complete len:64 (-) comp21398_c0_seq6:266-457(-)